MLAKTGIRFACTPQLLVQYCTLHPGRVVKVGDPEGRNRVKVECSGLRGEGKENWTDWIEVAGMRCGSDHHKGDQGDWRPLQKGQMVLVGFLCGDPEAYFCIPAPPVQDGEGKDKQYVPAEVKKVTKGNPRDQARVECWKDEAGNTVFFDSRGKKEKLWITDCVGGGLFLVCPGQVEDEKEKEDEESKARKGKRRGMKSAALGNTEKPSKIMRDGAHILSLLGLMQAGQIQYVADKYGHWAAYMRGEDGKIAASVFLNGKLPRIYLTCGDVQLQLRGDKGDIAVTRLEIKEIDKKTPVEDVIEQLLELQKKEFEEFKEDEE